MVKVKLEHVN